MVESDQRTGADRSPQGAGERALVLLSGGIDSAVALAWARARGWNVRPVCFAHPGRPRREAEAARHVARSAGLPAPLEIDVPLLRMTGSPQYAWARVGGGRGDGKGEGLPAGYIPHRNLVYYGLALVVAAQEGARWIVGGHLKTDGLEHTDARPPFFEGLNSLAALGTPPGLGEPCRVVLPLAEMIREDCLREGVRLGVRLDLTWSCYLDGVSHCGTCAGCVDRRVGFQNAGIEDRTAYVGPLPPAPAGAQRQG